jgi:hypothetical protein
VSDTPANVSARGSKHHVVMVSSGAGSAAAWKRTVERHGASNVTGLFADVNGEDPDNYRFLHEVMCWVDAPLVVLDNGGRTIWDVFREARFLGNTRADICSRMLKREPMRAWLEAHHPAAETVVVGIGYDVDEGHRIAKAEPNWQPYELAAPLTWDPVLFRHEAHAMVRDAGIALPWLTRQGFPHANCGGGCVKAGHGQWRQLLRSNPAEFARWEAEEQAFRQWIGKDVSILRDRRKEADDIVLTLEAFRERVESDPQGSLFPIDSTEGACNCIGTWDDGPPPDGFEVSLSALTLTEEIEAYLIERYERPLTIASTRSRPAPTIGRSES